MRVGALGRRWWSAGAALRGAPGFRLFHGTNYEVPCGAARSGADRPRPLAPLAPETHERRRVWRARRRLPLMRWPPTPSSRRPRRAARGLRALRVAPSKVFAVHEAARDCFGRWTGGAAPAARDWDRRREFLLAVGTIEPRKNLATLVCAFEEVLRERPAPGLRLVIAGGRGWLSGPLFESIDKSPARGRVVLAGYVSDEQLRALYSACAAFVYPSLYEGFGCRRSKR